VTVSDLARRPTSFLLERLWACLFSFGGIERPWEYVTDRICLRLFSAASHEASEIQAPTVITNLTRRR
jgi:hypothetical protein